jgi:hypothetical protein
MWLVAAARFGQSQPLVFGDVLKQWREPSAAPCVGEQAVDAVGHSTQRTADDDQRSADGKLYRVVLAHFNNDITDVIWLKSVKDMLVEKYGNPDTFDIHGKMKASKWIKSENRLKLTTLTGKSVMCAIEYTSLGSESKKL